MTLIAASYIAALAITARLAGVPHPVPECIAVAALLALIFS